MMKRWHTGLTLMLALALCLCLCLAACGGSGRDDGSGGDDDTSAAPESFEGMVKDDSLLLLDYGMYFGAWADEDGALHIDTFGVFTEAPLGGDMSESDCEALAGTWYLDSEAADSILEISEDGTRCFAKMEIQFLLSKGFGTIPKMKTERFDFQSERSVF